MAMMLRGIMLAIVEAAATRAAEFAGLYPSRFMGGSITLPMAATSAEEDPEIPFLDTSPRGGVGLFPASCGQSGLGDDAPDLLPLRIRDAPERWTHVGFVDPPQD